MFRLILVAALVLTLMRGASAQPQVTATDVAIPQATIVLMSPILTGDGLVTVPVAIQCPEEITACLFSLDFDASAASFVGGQLASAVSDWTLLVNADPPYAPVTPGTTDNVRWIVFGGGLKRIDVTSPTVVATLTFDVTGSGAIGMDLRCPDNTSLVTFAPVVEVCDLSVLYADAPIATAPRTWSAVRELYR